MENEKEVGNGNVIPMTRTRVGKPVRNGQREQKKLTYNELVKVCNSMQNDIEKLVNRCKQLENNIGLARVGFLFEVVKLGEGVFEDIYHDAIAEISEGLYPSRPEKLDSEPACPTED